MKDRRTYILRQKILEAFAGCHPAPMSLDDIAENADIEFLKPDREELLDEWHGLIIRGYLKIHPDSGGEYAGITAKGLDQVNREGDRDRYIWGRLGLKVLCMILACLLPGFCGTGCASPKDKAMIVHNDVSACKISTGGTQDTPVTTAWFGWFKSLFATVPEADEGFLYYTSQDSSIFNSCKSHAGQTLIFIKGARQKGTEVKIEPEYLLDLGILKFGYGGSTATIKTPDGKTESVTVPGGSAAVIPLPMPDDHGSFGTIVPGYLTPEQLRALNEMPVYKPADEEEKPAGIGEIRAITVPGSRQDSYIVTDYLLGRTATE